MFNIFGADRRSVRPLAARDIDVFRALLYQRRASHPFLLGWAHEIGLQPQSSAQRFAFFGVRDRNRLYATALVLGDSFISVGHGEAEALDQLGRAMRKRYGRIQTISGPASAARRFVAAHERLGDPPRTSIDQVLMEIAPERARLPAPTVALEHPTEVDADLLAEMSAAMHVEELRVPIDEAARQRFALSVKYGIAQASLWCVRAPATGEVVFKVGVAPSAPRAAYVEGVYTREPWRRRGIATSAMSALCHELFQRHERVALSVRADNAGAIALYERLGFEVVDERAVDVLPPTSA